MDVIVSLDPRTLAMHRTATPSLSGGLVFGGGRAWGLDFGRPELTEIDPRTGNVVRTLATPPPSVTGDDGVVAGPDLLWVFRGSLLTELNPVTGQVITSARVSPIAAALCSPAIIIGAGLWYLAQTSHGTALDRVTSAR
jgi:outer membrane protein assembly factor BamB